MYRKEKGEIRNKGRPEADVSEWVASNTRQVNPSSTQGFRSLRFQPAVLNIPSTTYEQESESDSSSSTLFPEPLDGGYGWVIVLASFCIHFICDGISFSFGIMFPEIQQYFNATKTMSGVVGSIFLSIPLLSGPLAAVLTDIYDCRIMTFVGGVMAATGSFLSFFAFDIWHFMITFAIVTGVGLSFCYNTAIVAVTYYFQKKRALATGIAVCGSGAGTFVFAPVIEFLFNKFGWRITLVFLGLALLLLVGCGFMIKDLEWPQDTLEYKRKKFIEKTERERSRNRLRFIGDESSIFNVDVEWNGTEPRRAVSLPEISTSARWYLQRMEPTSSIQLVRDAISELQESVARSKSVGTFLRAASIAKELMSVPEPELAVQQELAHLDLQVSSNVPTNVSLNRRRVWSNTSHSVGDLDIGPNEVLGELGSIVTKNFSLSSSSSSGTCSTQSNEGDAGSSRFHAVANSSISEGNHSKSRPVEILDKKEGVRLSASVAVEHQPLLSEEQRGRRLIKSSLTARERIIANATPTARAVRFSTMLGGVGTAQGRVPASNIINYPWRQEAFGNGLNRRVPSAPAIFSRRKRKSRTLQISKMIESLVEWISVTKSLVIVPAFFTFLVSTFVLYIFFDIPYVNFPEYAVEHLNVTETEASYLVSAIGLMNMISMLLCGFLADWTYTREHIMVLYGVFIMLAGFCVTMAPFVESYFFLMVLCNGYGFFISANYVLASVITVHILCLYEFQTGYGLLCLVEGLGNLIGPALVGFIHDHIGTYDFIFLVGGSGTMISGFMVLLIEMYLRIRGDSSSDTDEGEQVKADSTQQTFVLSGETSNGSARCDEENRST